MSDKTTLNDVYEIYKKWLHIEDLKRIDVILAVALTREIKGTKLWLILVGNSGDWKSVQLNALDDGGLNSRVVKNMTARTLVSGSKYESDLAPELKDKLMLIPEMASILKLMPMDKAQVWAQLRDLYDGEAGKDSGMGKRARYTNLNITFIGGSTPAIDSQILIHQDLGSRELIWRTSENDNMDDGLTSEKCWDNEEHEEEMIYELRKVTQDFLRDNKYNKDIEISQDVKYKLIKKCNFLRIMRSPAEVDSYTGELLNPAHPEKPTRILKQFKRMYVALKSLSNDYDDEKALGVINHIIISSSFQNRCNVFKLLMENNNKIYSISKISEELKLGKKTIFKELNVLWNMGYVKRYLQEFENFGRVSEIITWSGNIKNMESLI